MEQHARNSQVHQKNMIELKLEEQFTETIFALTAILRGSDLQSIKRNRRRGDDPALGQNAA